MSHAPKRVLTQVFGAVGAVIERDGKFLLVKEHMPKHPDHGKWNQPAGWIDVGENPLDAVAREVREETGLTFTPTHILGLYSLVQKNNAGKFGEGSIPHPLKVIFLGTVGRMRVAAFDTGEVSENRWFTPEEINAMDSNVLRDIDIKKEVRDYLAGVRYPLELITHTVQR